MVPTFVIQCLEEHTSPFEHPVPEWAQTGEAALPVLANGPIGFPERIIPFTKLVFVGAFVLSQLIISLPNLWRDPWLASRRLIHASWAVT